MAHSTDPASAAPSDTRASARRQVADPSDAPDLSARGRRTVAKQANDSPEEATTTPIYKRPWFVALAALLLLAALFFGIRYYLHARAHESTDNAFIEGDAVRVSPRTAGTVRRVYVEDNQQVKAGTLLLELDPRDYQARLRQAEASVTSARAQQAATARAATARRSVIEQQRAQLAAAAAGLEQAQAEARAAQAQAGRDARDEQRYAELYKNDAVSRQRYDQALTAARSSAAQADAANKRTQTARAQVRQAQAAVAQATNDYQQATEQIGVAEAQIGEAQAAAAEAALQLSYTKIYAAESGRVTRKAVDEGQTVAVGQQLMALTYGQLWVTANFKETQLEKMRVGQPVEIEVDTYPDEKLHGRVESFQRGTGARFSLLPAENATGNYVKVVQRIPVKIVFDGQPNLHLLAPGMSVVPEVDISAEPTRKPTSPNNANSRPPSTARR